MRKIEGFLFASFYSKFCVASHQIWNAICLFLGIRLSPAIGNLLDIDTHIIFGEVQQANITDAEMDGKLNL